MDTPQEIIQREGKGADDPLDKGGHTVQGISEQAHPELFTHGDPSQATINQVYQDDYIRPFANIPYPKLRDELIDYGVNSGPHLAIQKLQSLLNVPVDGILGPQTYKALFNYDERDLVNRLMAERIKMYGRIVQNDPSQVKFLSGWLNRALSFLS